MERTVIFRSTALIVACYATAALVAQSGAGRENVHQTFAGTLVINAPSVEVVPRKRSFGFMIQHRFGSFGPDEQAGKQLFGLDLPANIRFGFLYAPFNGTQLELGRSKYGKVWDMSAKWRAWKQTVENEVPVSLTLVGNVAYMSDDFPPVGDRLFQSDGVTPFEYRDAYRLSYAAQAIIARRMSSSISLQMAPVLVYRNLVPVGDENLTLALTVSGRWKVTTKGSLLVEGTPMLAGKAGAMANIPVALAYEVATLGHVFQIVIASSQEIVEQRLYTASTSRYDEGYVHLGFNIARTLFVRPKPVKP